MGMKSAGFSSHATFSDGVCSWRTRWTVAREMPCSLAIWPRLWPRWRSRRMAARSRSSGRRPMCRAFEPGAPHAGADPLDDQVAFEFGDGADDDHDGAAQRAAGVDLLAEADELDVEPVQLVEHFEEVPDRPGDPVRRPDQDDIEAAAAGIPHQVIETGPARLRAGDPVGILVRRSGSRAGRPSAAGRAAGSRDADRRSRPADTGRRVSLAPSLRLGRRVLRDILLDELQQHVGHVLPLGGGGRLEGVVQLNGYVQIHSLHLLFLRLLDLPHLLST